MLHKVFLPALLSVVMLGGCKDNATQPPPSDAYLRWKALGVHNYSIDQVRTCFCVDGGQSMRVSIRADTISSVTRLSDGTSVPPQLAGAYYSVDSLFAIIQRGTSDSLVVIYNSQYSYPEKLDINPQLHPIDGGVLYMTSNLVVQ